MRPMGSCQDRFILMGDLRNLVAVASVLVFEIKYSPSGPDFSEESF